MPRTFNAALILGLAVVFLFLVLGGGLAQPAQARGYGNFSSITSTYENVRKFGARGDGVHDDQKAIQYALSYAGLRRTGLYFPPGVYLHSGFLNAGSVPIRGQGSLTRLVATTPTDSAILFSGKNAYISDIVLDCPSGNGYNYGVYNPSTALVTPSVPGASAIIMRKANGFTITRVIVKPGFYQGVVVQQSGAGQVYNNQIWTSQGYGIQVLASTYTYIYGNIVRSTAPAINSSIFVTLVNLPISLIGIISPVNNPSGASQNIYVGGNTLLGASYGGVYINCAYGTAVYSNYISGSFVDVLVYPLSYSGSTNQVAVNTRIQNNTLTQPHPPTTSFINDSYGVVAGQAVLSSTSQFIQNIQISGNNISNQFYGAYVFGNNFGLNGLPLNSSISSNNISTCLIGVADQYDNTVQIANNTIDTVLVAIDSYSGTYTNAVIKGNKISNAAAPQFSTGFTPEVIYIDQFAGGASQLTCINNTYSGPANKLTYFIYATGLTAPPAVFSGNTNSVGLPSVVP